MQVHLTLPCYNPPENWAAKIVEKYRTLESRNPDWLLKLTVVNDGSLLNVTADDRALLEKEIRFIDWVECTQNRGKGAALREGFLSTSESVDIFAFTDVDFPYSIESLELLVAKVANRECDAAIGTRDAAYYRQLTTQRRVLSKTFRAVTGFLLRLKVNDTQCGLKAFNAKGRKVFLNCKINRFLFDLEFVFACSNSPEIHIVGYPVRLRDGVEFSQMNLRILWHESRVFLRLVLKKWFF